MIKSLEIKGLRGIRGGELHDFSRLVVLVGPNGSGKSTILDALLMCANPRPGSGIGRAVERHRGNVRGARWLFWKTGTDVPTEIVVKTDDHITQKCTLRHGNHPHIVECQFFANVKGDRASHNFPILFTADNRFDLTEDDPFYEGVADVHLVETWSGATSQPLLHQVYTAASEQGRKKQAIQLVKELVHGLENIEVLTDANQPYLALSFEERSVPAELAGDGISSLVRMCFELAASPGGLILIEEPEIHLHPGAIRKSAQAILAAVRRGVQVVLSTHSLEFVDALIADADEVDLKILSLFRLRLVQGKLSSSKLTGDEVVSSRTEIEDDLR